MEDESILIESSDNSHNGLGGSNNSNNSNNSNKKASRTALVRWSRRTIYVRVATMLAVIGYTYHVTELKQTARALLLPGRSTLLKAASSTNRTATIVKKEGNGSLSLSWPDSLIHDQTLHWDPTVYRPWLDPDLTVDEQPPAVILLTSYGWNHPDQTKATSTMARSIRETELLEGVINHPWFHPTLWDELEHSKNLQQLKLPTHVRYYVFADVQQCPDFNYPNYGAAREANMDTRYNRTTQHHAPHRIVYPPLLQNSRLFDQKQKQKLNATAIHFDCFGNGLPGLQDKNSRVTGTTSTFPLSVATLSSIISNVNEHWDQGLVAPPVKPTTLTPQQVHDIHTCEAETNRKLYFVYAGNYRVGVNSNFTARWGGARGAYKPFHDNQRFFVTRYFLDEFQTSNLSHYTYEEFMSQTVFALAARGDNKFSYRFTEALSAGAIPVVHSDDWVWPFRPELVDWSQCAVIRPEKDAGWTTIQYLESLTKEQRCEMRRACYRIYKQYIETSTGIISGLVEGLELATKHGPTRLKGVRCDDFHDPDECNLQR